MACLPTLMCSCYCSVYRGCRFAPAVLLQESRSIFYSCDAIEHYPILSWDDELEVWTLPTASKASALSYRDVGLGHLGQAAERLGRPLLLEAGGVGAHVQEHGVTPVTCCHGWPTSCGAAPDAATQKRSVDGGEGQRGQKAMYFSVEG